MTDDDEGATPPLASPHPPHIVSMGSKGFVIPPRAGCVAPSALNDEFPFNASNPVDTLIKKWCSDDDDKNVVYKKNGQERYPNFKLYKMIARTVHGHSPKSQLTSPVFAVFVQSGKTLDRDGIVINIDEIPKYKFTK